MGEKKSPPSLLFGVMMKNKVHCYCCNRVVGMMEFHGFYPSTYDERGNSQGPIVGPFCTLCYIDHTKRRRKHPTRIRRCE